MSKLQQHLAVWTVGAVLLGGCATFQPPMQSARPPAAVAAKAFQPGKAPVALVLSGGAARGFAHVGVIKVLEAQGLKPDIIVGTSAGSIVGGLYASGLTARELSEAVAQLDSSAFTDFVLPGLGFLPGEMGLVRGENLRRFLDARLKTHYIEDFPIRFAAVATELSSGKSTAFNAGDAGLAIVASSAVPGVVMPVVIDRRYYGDGQIVSPLPVETARALGAKVIIAVDVVYPPQDAFLSSAVSVLFQSLTVSIHQVKEHEKAAATLVISPALEKNAGQFTFADRERLVTAGERATLEMLPAIRAAFDGATIACERL
jgi:NTE family protein